MYTEVQGRGSASSPYAFIISNGSTDGTVNAWMGTVWAPYAAITVGAGSTASKVIGALWSGTQVNVSSALTIEHAPFAGLKFSQYPPNSPGKVNEILGPELTSLAANFGNVTDKGETIFRIDEANARVIIEAIPLAGKRAELLDTLLKPVYGITNVVPNLENETITGFFPIANLLLQTHWH